jgi:hypothetical protein
MFNWLFKKKEDKSLTRIKELEESLKISFTNIKRDINNLFENSNYLFERDKQVQERLNEIIKRLTILETLIHQDHKEEQDEPEGEKEEEDHLTEISQKICMVLAALTKESSEKEVSLKALAEEMYPNTPYNKIRSTISQYTTDLEKLGYLVKIKKGRHAYLKSTDKNPFLKKRIKLVKKIKAKN